MESFISLIKDKAVIFRSWLETNNYFRVYSRLDADCLAGVVILVNLFKTLGKSFHLSFASDLSNESISPCGNPLVFVGLNKVVNGCKSLCINNQAPCTVVSPDFIEFNNPLMSVSGITYLFSREFVDFALCAKVAVIGSKAGQVDLSSPVNQLITIDIPPGTDGVYCGRVFDEWINMANECLSNGNPCLAVSSFLNAR